MPTVKTSVLRFTEPLRGNFRTLSTLTKLLLILTLLLPSVPGAMTQDANPTIAILRYGPLSSYMVTEGAILDMLETYELINAEERAVLDERRGLEGENINIIWGDGNFDVPTVNLIIEDALDQEADVLLTLSLPIMQVAVNVTVDMGDPPAVLFTSVYHPATLSHQLSHPDVDVDVEFNPFAGGTAAASCLKADHVTGVETENTYGRIVPLLLLQNPDIKVIGIIHSSSELSDLHGAKDILEASEELGIAVESAAVTSVADLAFAADGLIRKVVEAFFIPADIVTIRGLPILTDIAIENGIPVFHSTLGAIFDGATVGVGSSQYYTQGVDVARLLIGYLGGEIDIATTGIYVQDAIGVGVNLDSATLQDVEVSAALQEVVDVVIQDGELRVSEETLADPTAADELRRLVNALSQFEDISIAPELLAYVEGLTPADLRAGNSEFFANVFCSPERIAEQQAEVAEALRRLDGRELTPTQICRAKTARWGQFASTAPFAFMTHSSVRSIK